MPPSHLSTYHSPQPSNSPPCDVKVCEGEEARAPLRAQLRGRLQSAVQVEDAGVEGHEDVHVRRQTFVPRVAPAYAQTLDQSWYVMTLLEKNGWSSGLFDRHSISFASGWQKSYCAGGGGGTEI